MEKITEIYAKDALHKLKRRGLPYNYDLNVYRGCAHACTYCYARKSHKYISSNEFYNEIFVKVNIIEALEQILKYDKWEKPIINIGGVCDSYQPCEEQYRLMPEILKLMIKYNNPVIISTKSDLILRDIELIDELSRNTYVNIAFTISTNDELTSKKLEPGAAAPGKRFEALREFSGTNACTGFHLMPILPFIADDEETLRTMVEWAHDADVSYMLTGMLYMTGAIRENYLLFIEKNYPGFLSAYKKLYKFGAADKDYKSRIHGILNRYKAEYGVNNNYSKFLPKKNTFMHSNPAQLQIPL